MDTTQIQEKLNGKSFNSDLNEITYFFIKDTDILNILENGKTIRSRYTVFSDNDGHVSLNFEIHNELLKFEILSSYHEPFKIKLWGSDSRKYFGVLTEIIN